MVVLIMLNDDNVFLRDQILQSSIQRDLELMRYNSDPYAMFRLQNELNMLSDFPLTDIDTNKINGGL